jgi:hypothetical protein
MDRKLVMVLILAAGAVIAAAFALSTCGDGSGDDAPRDGVQDDRRLELAPIDDLEMIIRESFPPQYAVRIVSGLPNGCALFHSVELVSQDDAVFEFRVENSMPADRDTVCTAVYGTHEQIVELGSGLRAGQTYTVKVNDKELMFTAQ